ncbi:hypothetical protein CTAYLR_007383 [Chrysophaeum taylorii]|uniref:Mitochondrial inner membrane protease ATP23 n=1 Tax=Chrysophaeum taylorii TaxID=2483200 RepID=A0AAD7U6W2_9STRA|nr:hypothetical protein CTAYLR_007383 [Chrysophaeum taylorii]
MSDHNKCLRFRERAKRNPRVQHVLAAIEGLGCQTGTYEDLVACVSKDSQPGLALSGGFSPHVDQEGPYAPKILMVEEHNADQATFDRTLIHELVHAYDQCRANVDWRDPRHLACAEVRASNLSGECEFIQEINRGKFGIVNHNQACVRRRAALSVTLGHGTTQDLAARVVDSVYDRCYHDKTPFDQDK